MTRRAALLNDDERETAQLERRPVKRLKSHGAAVNGSDTKDQSTLVRRHPLGVRPSGNALTSSVNAKWSCGLFGRLPDELIMQFFEMLQVPHLLKLGSTCKALHAFSRSEELWRSLFVE